MPFPDAVAKAPMLTGMVGAVGLPKMMKKRGKQKSYAINIERKKRKSIGIPYGIWILMILSRENHEKNIVFISQFNFNFLYRREILI